MKQTKGYDRTYGSRHRKRRSKRKQYLLTIVVIFAITISVSVWVMKTPKEILVGAQTSSDTVSGLQNETTNGLASTIEPEHPEQSSLPSTTESNNNNNKESVVEIGYDYSQPVPESDMVENSYFDDAVFIGDSRTEGFILYSGLSNAISYANQGLMVDTVFTKPVINMSGSKISVMDALRQTDFSKVYIMLGINETGWPYSSVFIEKYGKIIDEIKDINPKAVIYVQEILPVTDKVSQTHSYVKNEKIKEYNALIRQMAEEKEIYYIDTGNAVADANGSLPEDAASDGIHLNKSYCEKWLEYLKKHTVTNVER